MALTIVAQITAVPGKEELVRTALEKLIPPTLAEAGCLQYDLHVDNENPGFFLFFENWETRELWQDHIKSAHIAAHREATAGAIANTQINEMTKVD